MTNGSLTSPSSSLIKAVILANAVTDEASLSTSDEMSSLLADEMSCPEGEELVVAVHLRLQIKAEEVAALVRDILSLSENMTRSLGSTDNGTHSYGKDD